MQAQTESTAVPEGRHRGEESATDRLRAAAEAWLTDDPDPITRAELRAAIDALPASAVDLADRFAGPLTFGTAGLRGPVRAGCNGMNRAVVRAAAAGLVAWLTAQDDHGPIVIGYDARNGSADFADETARVVTGSGRVALVLPGPLPTPVLAYAVAHLCADGTVSGSAPAQPMSAGVMVTASHNPPLDNGYKVYLGTGLGGEFGGGAQLAPPADVAIEAAIRAVGPLADTPLGPAGVIVGPEIVEAYVRDTVAIVDVDGARELSIAYTPMHGVGADVALRVFAAAGFDEVAMVAEQATPDPTFPTLPFPNPEEPGAMDLVTAVARAVDADIAIANDPDADRCAIAIPTGDGDRWRTLRGDEVGILLADHLMRRGVRGLYATTIVSSSLLRLMCQRRGQPYAETLTGFKWIMRAGPSLVYGYEEAIGFCVDPASVRDKDGMSAALMIAELAAGLKTELRTLQDRLDDIAADYGVYATDQLSARVEDLAEIGALMAQIRQHPPATLLDAPVSSVVDLRPDNDVLTLRTASARVVVRPSGTEPKLKAYLEVIEAVVDGDVHAARERAAASLSALRTETAAALGLE
ncbi:MAG TPA: phospho-sugar mutase [Micromonosporaceae bacterium]